MKLRCATTALAAVVFAVPAVAQVPCRSIRGTVETHAVPCDPGACFEGTLKTNSPLKGTTSFTATSVTPVEGTALIRYVGVLTVTLPNGAQVVFESEGEVDLARMTFTETDTRQTEDGTVTLTITGTTDASLSGFSGEIAGELCGSHPFGRRS